MLLNTNAYGRKKIIKTSKMSTIGYLLIQNDVSLKDLELILDPINYYYHNLINTQLNSYLVSYRTIIYVITGK